MWLGMWPTDLQSARRPVNSQRLDDTTHQVRTVMSGEGVVQHWFTTPIERNPAPVMIAGNDDDIANMRKATHQSLVLLSAAPGQDHGSYAGMYWCSFERHAITLPVEVIELRHITAHHNALPAFHGRLVYPIAQTGRV